MINKYPGTCSCGARVETGAGEAVKADGRWAVRCAACAAPDAGGATTLARPASSAPAATSADVYTLLSGHPASSYQAAVFDHFKYGRGSRIVNAVAGSGKCLGYGEKVLMHDGSIKEVQDITVGDVLMGSTSSPRTVLSTSAGFGQLYRIIPVKGESWVCNDVHVLTLVNSVTGEVFDIPLNDWMTHHGSRRLADAKLFREKVDFPSKDTEIDPYLLGLWLGDGSKDGPSITNHDLEIIDYCLDIAPKYGCGVTLRDDPGCVNIRFRMGGRGEAGRHTPHVLWRGLKKCVLTGEKRIPKDYMVNDRRNRLLLLAGILDSDGSLGGNCFELTSSVKGLFDDYLFLCRSLGFAAYRKIKMIGGKPYYRLHVSGDVDQIPTRVARKIAKPRLQKKDVLRTGFRVEFCGPGSYFGFTLDGDGRFLLGDFTVTHNTTTMKNALAYLPDWMHVQMLAFNVEATEQLKAAIEELRTKTGRPFAHVRANSFHSLGMGAIRKYLNLPDAQIKVDPGKCRRLLADHLCVTPEGEETFRVYGAFAATLVRLAKGEGIGALVPDTEERWYDLVEHHGLYIDTLDAEVRVGIELARRLLGWSNEAARGGFLDYEDQLYLVILWKLRLWQNHVVIADEVQDTNAVRRAMLHLALKDGGRLYAVGDPQQSIYGFCHPSGTPILTPNGFIKIEDIRKGDPIIIADPSGESSGWSGTKTVIETHEFYHSGFILTISANGRTVDMTPHHRVPVRIDASVTYYTYLMRRNGVYRVGSCQAGANSGLTYTTAAIAAAYSAVWLLGAHVSKEEARTAENKFLERVKGTTFHDKNDEQIAKMPSDEIEALKILSEHGRMVDFPLLTTGTKSPRIARNGCFVTEACNIIDGMLVAFFDNAQIVENNDRRGKGRQNYVWTPAHVTMRPYSGKVYGITVPSMLIYNRGGYYAQTTLPLYFAGPGQILVHNTGASTDAMDMIAREFNTAELPLTVSYRCARTIVERAQTWVPYIEAAESAPEGSVADDLPLHAALAELEPTDAILCRQTAPLVTVAYGLIARGRACRILGREIGEGLVNLIEQQKARGVDRLVAKLEAWREREMAKFIAKGEETRAEAVADRVDCVLVIAAALPETERTVPSLVTRIRGIFVDPVRGEPQKVLTLCTVHRAKGKEWPTVAILRPDLMPSRAARQSWAQDQETNLMYVAATRAKGRLIYIADEDMNLEEKK